MGLDWIIVPRARPGFEEAYAKVMRERALLKEFAENDGALLEVPDDHYVDYTSARDWLQMEVERLLPHVSVGSYEELGCPRIGIDPEATEWLRGYAERMRGVYLTEPGFAYWRRPFEEIVASYRGHYIPALAKVKGEGVWDNAPTSGEVGFRANLLRREAAVSPELLGEAYRDHNPAETLDYADRMAQDLAGGRDPEMCDWDGVYGRAVRWLRFWGGRGFGFWASY